MGAVFDGSLFDADIADEVRERVAEQEPLSFSLAQALDPRAFKHVSNPVVERLRGLDVLTEDDAFTIGEGAWARVVEASLRSSLDMPFQLSRGPYNSAYARFVDGLSGNHEGLPSGMRLHVDAGVLADAVHAEMSGEFFQGGCPGTSRPSAASSGVSALVGREVTVSSPALADDVFGIMVACSGQEVVVRTAEGLAVLSRPYLITTVQLTPEEDELPFPGMWG